MQKETLKKINNISRLIFAVALVVFATAIAIWIIKCLIK